MTILGIETSCDETAVSVVRGRGGLAAPRFEILAHIVASQIKTHAPYGGVVPSLAKREHGKNLVPVLLEALKKSKVRSQKAKLQTKSQKLEEKVKQILTREIELVEPFLDFIKTDQVPKIDAIAVTQGPGLEPALWTGINFAKALATVWRKPLIPINHLEGHIVSVLAQNGKPPNKQSKVRPLVPQGLTLKLKFPVIALLISGGHTELVLIRDWFKYRIIGQTRDDAVGEAFDKVARLLGLPYPGGPALAALADKAAKSARAPLIKLPLPMIDSPDLDFSFSGLKTAVLYLVQEISRKRSSLRVTQGSTLNGAIATEFQQAVIDVLIRKTTMAIELYQPRTMVVAGGVAANRALRRQFTTSIAKLDEPPDLLFPPPELTTDNATMIAMAGYLRLQGSLINQGSLNQGPTLKIKNLKVGPLVKPLIKIRASGRLVLK